MDEMNAHNGIGFRLKVALAASVAILCVGVSMSGVSFSDASGSSEVRALTPSQKKAKAKAMAKCKKIKAKSRRAACIRQVNKKFAPKPAAGKTWQVGVWDNYYLPDDLPSLKVNDSIRWEWKEENGREAHDVGILSGPRGINPYDFASPTTAVFGTRFERKFTVPGSYEFICSLHYDMTMQVKVTR